VRLGIGSRVYFIDIQHAIAIKVFVGIEAGELRASKVNKKLRLGIYMMNDRIACKDEFRQMRAVRYWLQEIVPERSRNSALAHTQVQQRRNIHNHVPIEQECRTTVQSRQRGQFPDGISTQVKVHQPCQIRQTLEIRDSGVRGFQRRNLRHVRSIKIAIRLT